MKVFKQCVRFEPRERPAMADVVRRLKWIIEEADAAPAKLSAKAGPRVLSGKKKASDLPSPWRTAPNVSTAMDTFASRIEDPTARGKLEELRKEVEAALGPQAINNSYGVYNVVRLYRFLRISNMDVKDAKVMTVLNSNARLEFKADEKRRRIIEDDLNYDTLPRFRELITYQPINNFVGRGKDGCIIGYIHLGRDFDIDGLTGAFSIEDYLELVMTCKELKWILRDTISAISGRGESA